MSQLGIVRKRILLLTFFYPPDLAAGSFRAQALAEAIREQSGGQVLIDVLTTQPNRYLCHADQTHTVEEDGSVRIQRIQLPAHQNGFLDQTISFASFAYQAIRLARDERYDVVVATSSRLMTAVIGAWIACRQGARLYLDIRDIFVENIGELFHSYISKPLVMFFGALERWAVRRADKVNLVTAGFLGYFKPRYPKQQFSLYSNGVDDDFLDFPIKTHETGGFNKPLKALYAGNIGDGQGLHLIVPKLAQRLSDRVHFQIVGAGGRLKDLQEAVASDALNNVELIAPVAREQLLDMYYQADILFLHLNDFEAFHRVLPSKLFEYAATGKPLWAGVAGYAAEFIKEEISNTAVFSPCNIENAIEALGQLNLKHKRRPEFIERYGRSKIMRSMAKDVLELTKEDIQDEKL
jgi:glycosyltransferase involved in cell wall biosynthesis